jgi:hypothetical protein
MLLFWNVMLCSLAHHPNDGGSKSLETSVNFYQTTWHNIPEDSYLHICHHENLKSHTPHKQFSWVRPEIIFSRPCSASSPHEMNLLFFFHCFVFLCCYSHIFHQIFLFIISNHLVPAHIASSWHSYIT